MHGVLLTFHIAAGTAGLVLGPVAMTAPKRRGRHTSAGRWYQLATAVLCATAVGLALLDWPALWWFSPIAVGTEAAALGGWWMQWRRPPGWVRMHVSLMCGSYVSFVTALLVVNTDSFAAWILPTIIGSPLIALASERASRRIPAMR